MSYPLITDNTAPAIRQGKPAIPERRAAYAALIAPLETVMLRVAWRFCPGQQEYAQDLVQEALVRGYEAFLKGRFQEDTNARAWLLTILTHCFLTDQRRRRRIVETDVAPLLETGAQGMAVSERAQTGQPETALLATVLDEPMEQALAALPEDLRLCVILRDIEELSYAEVAEVVNIPLGTVRSRLFRARKQLASQLQDYVQEYRRI